MNIVRKLLTQRDEQNGAMPNTDHSLSLMHLNKLFNELKLNSGQLINGPGGGDRISKYDTESHAAMADYEQKVYRLLPLFLKVCCGVFSIHISVAIVFLILIKIGVWRRAGPWRDIAKRKQR